MTKPERAGLKGTPSIIHYIGFIKLNAPECMLNVDTYLCQLGAKCWRCPRTSLLLDFGHVCFVVGGAHSPVRLPVRRSNRIVHMHERTF